LLEFSVDLLQLRPNIQLPLMSMMALEVASMLH
jgi:hypothetical protein